MATKRRKIRKSRKSRRRSRKSCKYGKLKRPIKTKSGRKRRCKKKRKSKKRKYNFLNCRKPANIPTCQTNDLGEKIDPVTLEVIPDNANENDYVQFVKSRQCIHMNTYNQLRQPNGYIEDPTSRELSRCEVINPVNIPGGNNYYMTEERVLRRELNGIAFLLADEQPDYRNYSSYLQEYSDKIYTPNNLRTEMLELSSQLEDVDPYFTRMIRSVTTKLERAKQLFRIVYENGISYYEQVMGAPYSRPFST